MRASVVAVKNNTKPRAADVDAAIFIQTAESEKANERRTPFLLGPKETRREEGWSWFVRSRGEWFMTPCHVHNLVGKTAIPLSLSLRYAKSAEIFTTT